MAIIISMTIITEDGVSVSYDKVSGIAIGPIFYNARDYDGLQSCGLDSHEMAEKFWNWFLTPDVELYDNHDWDSKRAEFIDHLIENHTVEAYA